MAAFNYNLQAPNIEQQTMAGFSGGFALGDAQRQAMAQRQAAEQKAAQEAEYRRIQGEFYATPNPTAMDVIRFANTLPAAQVTALKDQFAALPAEAQQRELQQGAQIISALNSGSGEVASAIMMERAQAARNSGDAQKAQQWETLAKVGQTDPQLAARSIMPMMAVLPGGKAAIESILAVNKAPMEEAKLTSEAAKASAEASSAATAAKFAESKAVAELKLNDAQIKKFAADTEIARMNARIAAMNAATAREGNSLKKQELGLKIQEMQDARDAKLREKVSTVESGRASMDNMLNTIDRVINNPALDDVLGSFEGRMPEASSMLDDQESDAIALIETLGSQAFIAQIPNIKGMGALSNEEGKKLQSALQNLSRAQSEKQFKANLKEAQRLVLLGRKNLAKQYGVPDSVPDTPAANPSASEVDALIKQYAR
jgi:hypothetical protein